MFSFERLLVIEEDGRCFPYPFNNTRARIFILFRSPRIDSKEPIPPGCVLCSLASRYDKPISTRFLAPPKLFNNFQHRTLSLSLSLSCSLSNSLMTTFALVYSMPLEFKSKFFSFMPCRSGFKTGGPSGDARRKWRRPASAFTTSKWAAFAPGSNPGLPPPPHRSPP